MLCHCGSGKKYKRCCRVKDEGMRNLFEKLATGQLPLRAAIISESGEASSMDVHHASMMKDGKVTVLLDEKITLSTNSTSGDKTTASAASISIPTDGLSLGAIRTIGNASVSNISDYPKISLAAGVKKIKATSELGLFVVARTRLQRNTQIEYFDFLFGVRGQTESVDDSGEKQRPHITIYPDGNGKFIRLSGHNCEIESDMQYSSESRQVLLQQLRIKSLDTGQVIMVVFSMENPNVVVLNELRFI